MIRNIKSIFICSLLPILLVVSCKKEVKEILPGNISGGVNFYNGSEVLNSRQSLRKNNLVFINDSVPNGPFRLFPKYQDKPAICGNTHIMPQALYFLIPALYLQVTSICITCPLLWVIINSFFQARTKYFLKTYKRL